MQLQTKLPSNYLQITRPECLSILNNTNGAGLHSIVKSGSSLLMVGSRGP
jgi:hypothetical protein